MTSYTYSTMQTRIADELDRVDLQSQIQNAIQDAIGFYERKYFYFNDNPSAFTFNTVKSQEYYTSTDNAAIATISQLISMTGTFFGLRRPINPKSWAYIGSISTLTTSLAMPQIYAYAGEQIRLYPIPDNAYPILVFAVPRLTRPISSSDGGVWMNDAEALIRTKAKLYLFRNVIRSSDMENEVALLEDQLTREYAVLTGETTSREATGSVEPVMF